MQAEEGQLKEFLLEGGLVSRSQLDATLRQAKGRSLSQALIESGVLSEEEVRRACAHALGIPHVVLEHNDIDLSALISIPEPICRVHSVVAYRRGEQGIEVSLLDMADLSALEFPRGGVRILPRLTSRESLRRALLSYQKHLKEKFGSKLEGTRSGEEALETLLAHALSQNASTIYLEPTESGFRVRYRIGGVLHEAMALSQKSAQGAIAHLKQLAKLDVSATLPQEARLKAALGEEDLTLRIATLPTALGERVALHLVSDAAGRKGFTLESLGLHGEALEYLCGVLQQKSGLVVVAGKEGSGVSTTLYTLLDVLNRPNLLLASVEQDIEYRLPHVAQTRVGEGTGISPAAALRATLRQDPDVVMIGETLDGDAALLAVQAAKNRMIFLGVQADSAAEAIEKLFSFGIAEALLTSAPLTVVSQRLVRRLCKNYREEKRLSRPESHAFEGKADFGRVLAALKEEGIAPKTTSWKDIPFFTAEPCNECRGGYRGNVGIFEVLDGEGNPVGLTLPEDGLFKAAQGLTSIDEVLVVIEK